MCNRAVLAIMVAFAVAPLMAQASTIKIKQCDNWNGPYAPYIQQCQSGTKTNIGKCCGQYIHLQNSDGTIKIKRCRGGNNIKIIQCQNFNSKNGKKCAYGPLAKIACNDQTVHIQNSDQTVSSSGIISQVAQASSLLAGASELNVTTTASAGTNDCDDEDDKNNALVTAVIVLALALTVSLCGNGCQIYSSRQRGSANPTVDAQGESAPDDDAEGNDGDDDAEGNDGDDDAFKPTGRASGRASVFTI